MKASSHGLIPLLAAFAKKDLYYIRWYAACVWGLAAAAVLAKLLTLFGWAGPESVLGPYAGRFATFIAYLGTLAVVTLDCPWDGRSFAVGKPVSGVAILAAKLTAIVVGFGGPLLLLPGVSGSIPAASGFAIGASITLLLLCLHATLPFSRSVFALLVHGLGFVAVFNGIGVSGVPMPRFDHPAFLLLWDVWLAAGVFVAVSLRSRILALTCSALVVAVFAIGGFTLRRF
jgi:hypothetical protein